MQVTKVQISWRCPWKEYFLFFYTAYVLQSSGISRKSGALIVRYRQKKEWFLLFSIVLRILLLLITFGTTSPIQVGFSAKRNLSKWTLISNRKLKMSHVWFQIDFPRLYLKSRPFHFLNSGNVLKTCITALSYNLPAGYILNIDSIRSAVRLYLTPLHPSVCGLMSDRNAADTPVVWDLLLTLGWDSDICCKESINEKSLVNIACTTGKQVSYHIACY